MNEKPILNKNEIFYGRSSEIDFEENYDLIKKISSEVKKVMRKHNLTALSAPSIGYNYRIFCVDFSDKEIKTFINPLVISVGDIQISREVCSSLPGKEYIIPRHNTVDIIYQKLDGTINKLQFKAVAAHVLQHELDHLDGILLSDFGLEIDTDFDDASEEDKFEIIDMYLKSLETLKKTIQQNIENDPVSKIIHDTEKLTELVASGKIEIKEMNND